MEKYIGKDIIVLSNRIKRRMRVAAEALGITDTQGRVLQYIWEESEKREVFQKDIEDEFDIRRSSVTQVIQILERDGLIVRESVERDARLKKLVLTKKAIHIQEVMNGKIRELEFQMQKDISEEEREIFLKILSKIKRNVV